MLQSSMLYISTPHLAPPTFLTSSSPVGSLSSEMTAKHQHCHVQDLALRVTELRLSCSGTRWPDIYCRPHTITLLAVACLGLVMLVVMGLQSVLDMQTTCLLR